MLGYIRRTAPAVARALLRRDGALVSRIERRVGPFELDTNLHMNQAVYAQVMELGRVDWFVRSGVFARWREQGISAVVASQRLIYRRELRLGTRYTIDTRALQMNGRLLEMHSNLLVGERVHARCELELIMLQGGSVLDADAATRACEGLMCEPLAIADWVVTG